MTRIEKLKAKLKTRPNDFEWNDAKRILEHEGYIEDTGGKTSGSKVAFVNSGGGTFIAHKPHPDNKLKKYSIEDLVSFLEKEGVL
jgi:hypothetical protein